MIAVYYRVVFVLALQVMLYELDVVDGFLQLERIFLPDGGWHIVERIVDGRHGRVHQPAGRPGGRCPVATGSAGGGHVPAQGVGGGTATGGRRNHRRRRHVQRSTHASRVQPTNEKPFGGDQVLDIDFQK